VIITGLLTAAITGILSLFGIKPSAGMVVKIAIAVKIVLVCLGLFFGVKLGRKRQAAEVATAPAPDPTAPAPDVKT
jgi:hypothetical protein